MSIQCLSSSLPNYSNDTAKDRRKEILLNTGALHRAIFKSVNFLSIATDAKGVIQIC